MERQRGSEVGSEGSEVLSGVDLGVRGSIDEVIEGIIVAAGSHYEQEAG